MGDVVDRGQPDGRARIILGGHEIDVVDGALAVAVDEIDEAAADPLDGRNIELHRTGASLVRGRAVLDEFGVGGGRVRDPEGHGAHAGTVRRGEAVGEAVGLGIDDEVNLTLAVQGHVLRAVARGDVEAELREQAG